MLENGIGIHHAGLLPLHKSLVEDLFNSGLLKVCFATETLAAGVNMPARTTVISCLSKRTGSGISKLTSAQLLQMAGRAGRRGKDVQGNVVLMRSRFEDAKEAHQMVLQPMEGIQSHFKSSYGMAANMLRKYNQSEAREIIERSFGTYLLSQQEVADQESELGVEAAVRNASELIRDMERSLDGRDVAEVRAYAKLTQRIAADERIERYLVAQRKEQEVAVMESLLPFARVGSAVLVNGEGDGADGTDSGDVFGALLGEAPAPMNGGPSPLNLVLLQQAGGGDSGGGRVALVEPSHVRQLDLDDTVGLPPAAADDLYRVLESARLRWQRSESGIWATDLVSPNGGYGSEVDKDLESKINVAAAAVVPLSVERVEVPGEIMSQRSILARLNQQLEAHPLHDDPEKESVLAAATQMTALELDLKKLVNRQERLRWKEGRFGLTRGKNAAWREFEAVTSALQSSDALDEDGRPNEFGNLIASINADNELWLAKVHRLTTLRTFSNVLDNLNLCSSYSLP